MIETVQWRSLPARRLTLAGVGEVTMLLRGAQIVSWRTADGCEQLYTSPRADLSPGAALRGGVPVCFPQFAGRGPLPQHGLVRTRDWQPVEDHEGGLAQTLADDDATRAVWPHRFRLVLAAGLSPDTLELRLSVTNTDRSAFTFMAALHTYLAVEEVTGCTLAGLPAGDAFDNTLGSRFRTTGASPDFSALDQQAIDEVHAGARGPLYLRDSKGLRLVESCGFDDCVVWNPGAAKARAMADLPAEDWQHFVCIEAARIEAPVTLAIGDEWRGCQKIHRLPR